MIHTIKSDKIEVKINSTGAELTSVISKDKHEYIWQGHEWKKHAPVLFPICGALLDSKFAYRGREYTLEKHGFAKLAEFELVEESDTSIVLEFKSNEKTLEIYPFDFVLTAKYTVNGSSLTASYTVENSGKVRTVVFADNIRAGYFIPPEHSFASHYLVPEEMEFYLNK
jgi:galactose mutarotase-like enzyme